MRLPSKSTDSTALIATRKKVFKKPERKCYGCRKPGHLAKDCWKKGSKPKVEGDAFVVINIDHLHVFRTECFVHVPQQKRRKWDKKSVKGFFVSYSGEKNGCRIWIKDQNKVSLSRDVIFQNEKLSCVPDASSTEIQNSDMEIVKKPLQTPEPDVEKEIEEILCNAEETLVQQSSRNLCDRSILKMPTKFDSFVLLAEHIEPETYKDAMASEDSDKWLSAMKEELESIQ
ncbi:retrovirus-related Pol polyprotein from transposon TNT 1-94 [Trichonephila clavata]|uniref:Retrovirus-related Pol polyprotein from transposon TNT 1-94 n=1 Tax=Trichonephila clavata TaxID=2740835 RepID=A0A8X6HC26_TRICU|nr:retrovirus-related Pol polyprotein from transposon TNT 1-94 [Trichonephila clavata]